ncbi:MAG: radical SAM/SPASM domain-containing protein [archaeon]
MRTVDDVLALPWDKDYPRAVQIETVSYCNGHCSCCPYEITSKLFPQSRMPDALFASILEQLRDFQPLLVAPYMNNEPLADVSFFSRLFAIRDVLPDAYIDVATNASLLTREKAELLLSSLVRVDEVKINFSSWKKEEYEGRTGLSYGRTLRNVLEFIDLARATNGRGRYRIILVGSDHPEEDRQFWGERGIEVSSYAKVSRGGIIDPSPSKSTITGCKYDRQDNWLHILSTGEVVLCCMDWFRRYRLGDLCTASIEQIWRGEQYTTIRDKIRNSTDLSFICNNCEWGT